MLTTILSPFFSAFIGWFTSWVAIKMLIYPKNPINIFGYKLQGVFPKRQNEFAIQLGELIAKEFISFEDISKKINNPAAIQKTMPFIEQHIDNFIKVKLKEEIPLLSMFITENTMSSIKKGMISEIESLFPTLISKMVDGLQNEIDVKKIVSEKVKNFNSDKFEQILNAIMSKEFTFVEIIGAVLGFIIGCLQLLFNMISF